MIKLLQNWNGVIEINGTTYENYSAIPSDLVLTDNMVIVLHGKQNVSERQRMNDSDDNIQYVKEL